MPDTPNITVTGLEGQIKQIRQLLDTRIKGRPLIIEFSGSPKSGKTTAISVFSLFLRRNGLRVETYPERASVSPLTSRKGHPDFNLWVSCASLEGLIEAVEKDLDIFILDRGIFDALVWNTYLAQKGKISRTEADVTAAFFAMDRWTRLIDLVCVTKCDPEISIQREYVNQLTTRRGRIMNEPTLFALNRAIDDTVAEYRSCFKKVITVDTSAMGTMEGTDLIVRQVLPALRHSLDESLCVLHRSQLSLAIPQKGFIDDLRLAETFVQMIRSAKEVLPQSRAENDPNYLIPIPCAVLVHDSKVLLLERKESGHPLDHTIAIWAGGHILESDGRNPDIIQGCLARELQEELHITALHGLELLGLVTTDQNERASRHIGIVFLAHLNDDQVALALGQDELAETRKDSVSGTMVRTDELNKYFSMMGDWAQSIVRKLWPEQAD